MLARGGHGEFGEARAYTVMGRQVHDAAGGWVLARAACRRTFRVVMVVGGHLVGMHVVRGNRPQVYVSVIRPPLREVVVQHWSKERQ